MNTRLHAVRALILALLFSVYLGAHGNGTAENKKWWRDKVDREYFVNELRARKIPFRVDSEGMIWYPAEEVERVDEVSRLTLERNRFVPGFSFEDPRDAALFKDRLTKQGIHYEVTERLGREWVIWSKSDDERAKAIQFSVEDEGILRSRGKDQQR